MSRTIVVNLLFGWLTLLMSFYLASNHDGFEMIGRWVAIQLACWAGALTLLRWRMAVLAPAFLIFCHNLLCFIAASLKSFHGAPRADALAIMALLEMPIIALLVLVLCYHGTLVHVEELPHTRLVKGPIQFQLAQIFAWMTLIALATIFAHWLQDSQETWVHVLLLFVQVIVWLVTAEQLLQPRIRWCLVIAMTLGMCGVWFVWLKYRQWDLELLRDNWGRMQTMLLLTVLSYRWAGWRIVSASIVDDLREIDDPKPEAPVPG